MESLTNNNEVSCEGDINLAGFTGGNSFIALFLLVWRILKQSYEGMELL